MTKWEKYLSLSTSERILFLQSLFLLPLIHVALGLLGFQKLRNLMAKFPADRQYPGTETQAIDEARQVARLVEAAARHGIYHATCLRQSLLIWWLLRWRGIGSELRIGIKKAEGQLFAHAWVRINDQIISDGVDVEKNFSAFENLSL